MVKTICTGYVDKEKEIYAIAVRNILCVPDVPNSDYHHDCRQSYGDVAAAHRNGEGAEGAEINTNIRVYC